MLRLAFSTLIAGAGFLALPDLWPALWLAISLALQATILAIGAPTAPWRRRAADIAMLLNASVFAASSAMFWFLGGPAARQFALFMLAGQAATSIVRRHDSPRDLWRYSAPFLIALLLLPLISLAGAQPQQRALYLVTALAAILLAVRLVAVGWANFTRERRVREALDEARRERLRAEAASAAKSEFLELMGHELRTPLNGVLGMAQAMAGANLPAEQRRQLDVIRASGEALLLLVDDILEASTNDPSDSELERGVIDVHALAAETEQTFDALGAAKGRSLKVVCLASAGELRAGDPRRMRQVMRSVAGVALKSVERGGVSIVVDGDADGLRLEVSGAFAEGSAVCALDQSGQLGGVRGGILLGAARDLARRMGGEFALVEGADGALTLVSRMAAPLQTGALPITGEAAPPAPDAPDDLRLRVLAAEDNPVNQLVLKTLLEQAGLAVHIVSDGEEAVAAWRDAPWDMVLMDIRMPRMDGMAAARAIRALEAASGRPHTPILAVTADAMPHQAQQYAEAGMDGLVSKPIRFAELAEVVAAAAEAAEARLNASTRSALRQAN